MLVLMFVAGLVVALALVGVVDRDRRGATLALLAELRASLALERTRTADLGALLQAATAERLNVSLPGAATVGPATPPLPAEILEELEALDSDAARGEFELLIRDYLQRHPDAAPARVLQAVMA